MFDSNTDAIVNLDKRHKIHFQIDIHMRLPNDYSNIKLLLRASMIFIKCLFLKIHWEKLYSLTYKQYQMKKVTFSGRKPIEKLV